MSVAANGFIRIEDALRDAFSFKFMNGAARLSTLRIRHDKLRFAASRNTQFRILIDVTKSMTRYGDGLFPVTDERGNPLDHNGFTEYGSIQDGTDRSVRAGPHFLKVIFLYTGRICRNGGAFDSDSVFFVASADSMVTSSSVSSRCFIPDHSIHS